MGITVIGTDYYDKFTIWNGYATDGNDTISALGDADFVNAAGGDDTVLGGTGNDKLLGAGGDDNLYGGADNDDIWGGPGDDYIWGGTGDDEVWGEDNADRLSGDDGADMLNGGNGDDALFGGAGGDTLIGGNGTDTASYGDSNGGVTVSLATGQGSGGYAQGDTLESIENLTGSYHADTLAGDDGANVLTGLDGHDLLKGGGGADTLYGGDGNDSINGGAGLDTLYGGYLGADAFIWSSTSDTGLTAATADVVMDFNRASGDLINLSGIDADVYAAGDQAFSFIGTAAFSGAPGEVRYYHSDGDTYIQMQTGTAVDVEGVIRLEGIHTPGAGWFVL